MRRTHSWPSASWQSTSSPKLLLSRSTRRSWRTCSTLSTKTTKASLRSENCSTSSWYSRKVTYRPMTCLPSARVWSYSYVDYYFDENRIEPWTIFALMLTPSFTLITGDISPEIAYRWIIGSPAWLSRVNGVRHSSAKTWNFNPSPKTQFWNHDDVISGLQ